jgi:HEPN domain-containing protein
MEQFFMNDKVTHKEWLEKADNDWNVVRILLKDGSPPHDAICFHCQQYVEKLIKGLLCRNDVECPKSHDIRRLAQLAEPFVPEIKNLLDGADTLSACAVANRYPDGFSNITKENMEAVVAITRKFADIVLPYLIYG